MEAEVRVLDAAGFAPLVADAAHVYGAAMERAPEAVVQRREIMTAHLTRDGFVAAVAPDTDGGVAGFGYGYLGAGGQWWHDVVAGALGRRPAREWMSGSWELAELHVDPQHQGRGTGRSLLGTLLAVTDASTVVLSTPDRESRARRLYRSAGFVDLLTGFRFPGSGEVYAIMGWRRAAGRTGDGSLA